MSDSQSAATSSAEAFWNAYFENRFATLMRNEAGCHGLARTLPSGGPAGLARAPQLQEIACPRALLVDYDTAADGRFALLPSRPPQAGAALQAMIERSYLYRDAAPFGKARMAELLLRCRQMLSDEPGTEALQTLLTGLVASSDGTFDAEIAALAFLLGELRDPSSATALLSVIRNAAGVPFARRVVHFSAVNSAFSAAWKSDAKALTPDLLVLMENADSSACQKIASLFERLYSTHEMESLHRHGEAWLTPTFWRQRLAPLSDPALWPALSAASLFWELRLSIVARLGAEHANLLRLLSADEVGVVRDAAVAGARLQAGAGWPGRGP